MTAASAASCPVCLRFCAPGAFATDEVIVGAERRRGQEDRLSSSAALQRQNPAACLMRLQVKALGKTQIFVLVVKLSSDSRCRRSSWSESYRKSERGTRLRPASARQRCRTTVTSKLHPLRVFKGLQITTAQRVRSASTLRKSYT